MKRKNKCHHHHSLIQHFYPLLLCFLLNLNLKQKYLFLFQCFLNQLSLSYLFLYNFPKPDYLLNFLCIHHLKHFLILDFWQNRLFLRLYLKMVLLIEKLHNSLRFSLLLKQLFLYNIPLSGCYCLYLKS